MRILTASALSLATSLALSLAIGATGAAQAKARVSMKLSFSGVPVGKFSYRLDVRGGRYAIAAKGRTGGVAALAARARGTATSSGQISPAGPVPAAHDVRWREGRKGKSGTMAMRLKAGQVASLALNPKKKRRGAVPVTPAHLENVIDPASAMIVPAPAKASGRTVCTRRLAVFDGVNRYDLKMRHARTVKVKARGYRGRAHVCAVTYVPVAGHKPGRKSLKRLSRATIEMTYAPLEKGVWGLWSFAVPTKWGTARGVARRFGG